MLWKVKLLILFALLFSTNLSSTSCYYEAIGFAIISYIDGIIFISVCYFSSPAIVILAFMFAYATLPNHNPYKFYCYIIWDVISNIYFHITIILLLRLLTPQRHHRTLLAFQRLGKRGFCCLLLYCSCLSHSCLPQCRIC